jgi:hypothetical protein
VQIVKAPEVHSFLTSESATPTAFTRRMPQIFRFMKPQAWIAIVFGFLLVAQWWRHDELQDEMTELRREIAATHSLLNSARATTLLNITPESPVPSATSPAARIGVPVEEPADVQLSRVEELEQVVNAQADLIEQLVARADAEDEKQRKALARAWGPEQAAGPPDTASAGDFRTAWAPASADAGVEWIEATFAKPADIAKLIVRQTSNPGAITKVVAVMDTGTEVPVWSGEDPSRGQTLADTPFAFPANVTASRVRVYLDTSKKPGWEEIDALQIIGRDGSQQWAKSVSASSTYATGRAADHIYTLDLNRTVRETNLGSNLLIERF